MAVYRFRGKWRAEVFLGGERVGSKSGFKTKGAAQRWFEERKAMYRRDGAPKEVATFDEALKRFKTYHWPTLRPGSRRIYEVDIKHRIAPYFRFMRLDRLTPEVQESFKLKVTGELGSRSARNCLDLFRLILNRAVKYGLIQKSPYCLDRIRVPKASYNWWDDPKHIQAFLREAKKSRYYAAYLLALETGMRFGELVGLCIGDVDFDHGRLHVHRQWLQKEKDYGPLKDSEPRWIDFDLEGELAIALKERCGDRSNGEALFTTGTGNHPTREKMGYKLFHATRERAKVPRITFHELRDTFASWYMIRHDNIWALKGILGHSDIKTTMIYAHLSKKRRRMTLTMADVITHKSLTCSDLRSVSNLDG